MGIRAIWLVHGWTHIPPDGPRNWLGIPFDLAIACGGVALGYLFSLRHRSASRPLFL